MSCIDPAAVRAHEERDRAGDVLRLAQPADSGLIGRRLGALAEGTFAGPGYLARHGVPMSLADLGGHRTIGFVSSASRAVMPLEFQVDGGARMISLPVSVTVSATATNAALARLGLGLVQVPRYRVARDLETGALVEVPADDPPASTPVYVLHPEGRQLPPRVRIFIEWASATISAGPAGS